MKTTEQIAEEMAKTVVEVVIGANPPVKSIDTETWEKAKQIDASNVLKSIPLKALLDVARAADRYDSLIVCSSDCKCASCVARKTLETSLQSLRDAGVDL